ncbi:toll/interleukin-1 receptor-like protein [Quercus lobata]|uniref:toll/interleukin-1 receptor-like protein n=1 Tax=Quercus lobata TaxID=97700 RepID=UPI0012442FC1|nr:toll/interleukin-1 receptor-like protein [Quercus lobata]
MLVNCHHLQHSGSQDIHTSSSLDSGDRLVSEFPVRLPPVLQAEFLHHHHSPRFKYDVFLSFHGNDTRDNFTNHLYSELIGNVIKAYRDEEGIEQGTFVAPELMKAIKESKFAIVVLSENYALLRMVLE